MRFVFSFSFLFLFFISVKPVSADTFYYQAQLLGKNENPLSGSYCALFSFYDRATSTPAETLIWPTATATPVLISVQNGIFSAALETGFHAADHSELFLGIEIAESAPEGCGGLDYENIAPRQQIKSPSRKFSLTELPPEEKEELLAEIKEGLLAEVIEIVKNAVAALKEIVVEVLRVKKIVIEEGLELRDRKTGEIYCAWIENGEWQKSNLPCQDAFTVKEQFVVAELPSESASTTGAAAGAAATSTLEITATGTPIRTEELPATTTPEIAAPPATTTETKTGNPDEQLP